MDKELAHWSFIGFVVLVVVARWNWIIFTEWRKNAKGHHHQSTPADSSADSTGIPIGIHWSQMCGETGDERRSETVRAARGEVK